MGIRSPKILVAFAFGLLALSTGGASASDPGYATTYVKVRAKAVDGKPLDTLYPGEPVLIHDCEDGWCYVTHDGPPGYVYAEYLEYDDDAVPLPEPEPEPQPQPDPFPQPDPGNGGIAQVCFYDEPGFGGANYCAVSGDFDDSLNQNEGNDQFGSVSVDPGVSVFVCEGAFFAPECTTYSNDQSSLGYFNNRISSFQVD